MSLNDRFTNHTYWGLFAPAGSPDTLQEAPRWPYAPRLSVKGRGGSIKKLRVRLQAAEITRFGPFDGFVSPVLGSPLAAFAALCSSAFDATRALGGSTIVGASAR